MKRFRHYTSRLTSSARGETFNPLTYPFLLATLAYGVGFSTLFWTSGVQNSSLFMAMTSLSPIMPIVWGIFSLATIILGIVYLLFHKPPAGRLSGLMGFMAWVFAGVCWLVTGGWLLFFSIALPNIYFWIWQYFSLVKFHGEDSEDEQTALDHDV